MQLKEKQSLPKTSFKAKVEPNSVHVNVKETILNPKKEASRIKSSDYRSWDRLDVDAELKKLDEQDSETSQFIPQKPASNLMKIPIVNSTINMDIKAPDNASRQELEYLADLEKVKGNECFKAQEYDDAVTFYHQRRFID